MTRRCGLTIAAATAAMVGSTFGFGVTLDAGGYASRWDASLSKPRGLAGGLSYNVGSGLGGPSGYTSFAGTMNFVDGSTPGDVQAAVEASFATWLAVDPVSGLGAGFTFTSDVGGAFTPFAPATGAEIDIFAFPGGVSFGGSTTTSVGGDVQQLTSGALLDDGLGAPGAGDAISGADILMNASAAWTIGQFQAVLTHEIGHALGLTDIDVPDVNPPGFYDDNYDPTNNDATLSNSWAAQINPMSPRDTLGLTLETFPTADVFHGVEILMESDISAAIVANPVLYNDDYAGRQFLYPVLPVPEPTKSVLTLVGLALTLCSRRRPARDR